MTKVSKNVGKANKPKVRLYGIAICSYLFNKLFDPDESFSKLQTDVKGQVDLNQKEHRTELLDWLNNWGCRQFKRSDHEDASAEICAWYKQHGPSLPGGDVDLWLANDAQLEAAANAYGALSKRRACKRGNSDVTIGPTGAAKILFAIRPRLLLPWDELIRQCFGHDGFHASYLAFLKNTRTEIIDLASECKQYGFSLSELPDRVRGPKDTVPQLVDNFYWITCQTFEPTPDRVRQWFEWSQPAVPPC